MTRQPKRYEGWRDLSGAHVEVDGVPLDPRHDLASLSPAGLEWTYVGAGPAQLSLALLADHLGDDARALAEHKAFMATVIAYLPNEWELTSADIESVLADLSGSVADSH